MRDAEWKLPDQHWDADDFNLFHLFNTTEANSTRLYMLVLYGLIRSNGWTHIAELGAYLGNTTALLAHAVKKNGGGVVHTYEFDAWKAAALRDRFETNSTVMVHQCASGSAPPLDGPVDLVFVDGDHTYEGALADIRCWAPRVKPNGYMAFHDVTSDPDIPRALMNARIPILNSITFDGDSGLLLVHMP